MLNLLAVASSLNYYSILLYYLRNIVQSNDFAITFNSVYREVVEVENDLINERRKYKKKSFQRVKQMKQNSFVRLFMLPVKNNFYNNDNSVTIRCTMETLLIIATCT